jgi:ribosomal protein S2
MEYHQRFLFAWKPGLLSNFKEFRKQKKFYYYKNLWHIPNFIISVTSEYHNDFKTEVKALDIPCAKLQDTAHKNFNFLYTLPANKKHTSSSLFFIALIQTALATGFTKKILTFSTKKFKT